MKIALTVNRARHEHDVEPRLLLVQYLREVLGLTGTHVGCETGLCGACTVMLDGAAVKSCMVLAVQADGSSVQTIEGLERDGKLDPVQQGFWERHALQCGYCTPGMIIAARALLDRNPKATEATPGAARALETSREFTCACAWGDRRMQTNWRSANRRSSTYWPRPRISRGSSVRLIRRPT